MIMASSSIEDGTDGDGDGRLPAKLAKLSAFKSGKSSVNKHSRGPLVTAHPKKSRQSKLIPNEEYETVQESNNTSRNRKRKATLLHSNESIHNIENIQSRANPDDPIDASDNKVPKSTIPKLKTKKPRILPSRPNLSVTRPSRQSDKSGKSRPKPSLSSSSTKPDWVAYKKEVSKLRILRKEKHPKYEVVAKAKKIYNKLLTVKDETCPTVVDGVVELHDVLKSHLAEVVYLHDVSRIVQWMIKSGKAYLRTSVTEELKSCVPRMVINRYASNCVKSMLLHGSKQSHAMIVDALMGKVVRFMSSTVSQPVVEYAYAECATKIQKIYMQQEFFTDLYKSSKDPQIKCLADTYKSTPEMKSAILTSMKMNITSMFQAKLQPAIMKSTLLFDVIEQYLGECNDTDRDEILVEVRDWVPDLPNNKSAAHVGMLCMWHGTNKEKKTLMKKLKGHVVQMATSAHLHWIILALIDSVDDTVVFSKIFLPEVTSDLKSLAKDTFGRRVIVYLTSHRHGMFFHPADIQILSTGQSSGTARKAVELRKKEIFSAMTTPLLESIAEDAPFWIGRTDLCVVSSVILVESTDGKAKGKALRAAAEYLTDSAAQVLCMKKGEKQSVMPLLEHTGTYKMLYKKLIHSCPSFAKKVAKRLTALIVEHWLQHDKGCYLLANLLESKQPVVVTKVRDFLADPALLKLFMTQNSPGAKMLQVTLESLI